MPQWSSNHGGRVGLPLQCGTSSAPCQLPVASCLWRHGLAAEATREDWRQGYVREGDRPRRTVKNGPQPMRAAAPNHAGCGPQPCGLRVHGCTGARVPSFLWRRQSPSACLLTGSNTGAQCTTTPPRAAAPALTLAPRRVRLVRPRACFHPLPAVFFQPRCRTCAAALRDRARSFRQRQKLHGGGAACSTVPPRHAHARPPASPTPISSLAASLISIYCRAERAAACSTANHSLKRRERLRSMCVNSPSRHSAPTLELGSRGNRQLRHECWIA